MPSSSKLFAVFIAVFFIINLIFASIIYLTGKFSMSPGSVVFSVLFGAAVAVAAGLLFRGVLQSYGVLAVLFLCMMASMVGAVVFMDTFALLTRGSARNVRVADALKYADAAALYFADGRVEQACVGEVQERDDDSWTTYYAVPYVPDRWDRTKPVTVWVTCTTDAAHCLKSTGIAMIAKTYTAGVAEAEKRCSIRSDPKAIRIEWIGPPDDIIRDGKKYLGFFAGGINALWVFAFLGMVIGLYRKHSRS